MELNNIPTQGSWGDAAGNVNDNFQKTKVAVEKLEQSTTKFKGYFSSLSLLTSAVPSPKIGDTAWVGDTYPGVVYDCITNGTWRDTTTVPSTGSVDLTGYIKQSDLTQTIGTSTTDAPSEKAVGDALNSLSNISNSNILGIQKQFDLTNNKYNGISTIGKFINLEGKINDSPTNVSKPYTLFEQVVTANKTYIIRNGSNQYAASNVGVLAFYNGNQQLSVVDMNNLETVKDGKKFTTPSNCNKIISNLVILSFDFTDNIELYEGVDTITDKRIPPQKYHLLELDKYQDNKTRNTGLIPLSEGDFSKVTISIEKDGVTISKPFMSFDFSRRKIINDTSITTTGISSLFFIPNIILDTSFTYIEKSASNYTPFGYIENKGVLCVNLTNNGGDHPYIYYVDKKGVRNTILNISADLTKINNSQKSSEIFEKIDSTTIRISILQKDGSVLLVGVYDLATKFTLNIASFCWTTNGSTVNFINQTIEYYSFVVEFPNRGYYPIDKLPISDVDADILERTVVVSSPSGVGAEQVSLRQLIQFISPDSKIIDKPFYACGDSTTYGAGSGASGTLGDYSWSDRLSEKISFTSYTKKAINGTTCMYHSDPIRSRLKDQIASIPAGTNGIITVMIGTNDADFGHEIGDISTAFSLAYETLDDTVNFSQSFRYCMETIKRKCPDAILLCMLPISPQAKTTISIDNYRDCERQICAKLSIPVIDTVGEIGINPYCNWDYFMADTLHPNNIGYERIANYMMGYFKRYL